METLEKEFSTGINSKETENLNNLFFGIAFITFELIEIANTVIDKWKSKTIRFRGSKVRVIKAPDPTDINWQYLIYSNK